MNITEKKLEDSQIELTISVDSDAVEEEYKNVFKKIMKTARIDGFRPGKAPLALVEKKYSEYADGEVAENIMRKKLADAIEEKSLRPVSAPGYSFNGITRGEPFSYSAIIELFPTVQLGKYKDVAVEEKSCNVTDKDITVEIDNLREKFAETVKLDDAMAVEKGNLVKVQVQRLTGEDEEASEAPGEYDVVVGKSEDEYSLDKHLPGMKTGEDKEIDVKYPKDYRVQELAGKKVKYSIKVLQVSKMDIPELTDELAVKAGFASADELTNKVKENVDSYVKNRTVGDAKAEIIEAVIKDSSFDIPKSFIEKEISAVHYRSQERISRRMGVPLDRLRELNIDVFASLMGLEPDEYKARLKEEALMSIKSQLVISEISKAEGMKLEEKRFEDFVEKYTKSSGMSADEVKDIIAKNNSRENIEADLMIEQVMDFLYENAKVKKLKPVSVEVLSKS